MPMYFRQFAVASREPFLTLETAAKVAASAADIHKFSAHNQMSMNQADWIHYGSGTPGTVSLSSDNSISISSGDRIQRVRSADRAVRFRADTTSNQPGVVFVSTEGTTSAYYVFTRTTSGDYALLQYSSFSYGRVSYTPVMSSLTGTNDWEFYFTERRFSSALDEWWVTLSIYVNGKLLDTLTHRRTSSMASLPMHYVGFRAGPTYTKVHISGASEVADPLTIDPGEAPINGLNRTIDGLHLKMLLRHDESLHVFRTGKGPNHPAPWSVTSDDVVPGQIEYEQNIGDIKPHVRVVGAYDWADYINDEWAERVGDRFVLINNPYLLSLAAVRDEARTAFLRMLEAYLRAAFTTNYNPFIEPEDQIEVLGQPFLVSGFNIAWSQTDAEQAFEVRHNPYA